MANNDLMVVSNEMASVFSTLKDKDLQIQAVKFAELGRKTLANVYEQYKILATIRRRQLYLKDFENFDACALELFGLSHSQATRMCQIADTFLHGENAERFMVYTPSALVEMLPKGEEKENITLHKKQLIGLMDNATINPDDSKTDIREKVKLEIRGEKPKDKVTEKVVTTEKKGEKVARLLGDLESYAKKKKDKWLTDTVKALTKEVNALMK